MRASSMPISDAEAVDARAAAVLGGQRGIAVATLAGLAVTGTAAAALTLTMRSLDWPLAHDAPLMHYVAARLREGAVPYRDLFDMNFPGVYLIHLLGLVVGGPGDGSFRALDLAVLAATLAGLGVALVAFGRWAVVSGVALFWLYHLAGGAWRAGQRDFLLCLPLAWTLAAALADLRDRTPRPTFRVLALAGFGLGAAMWIKPHALLLAPALIALALRRPHGARLRALTALGLGLALPTVAMLGWLALSGALPAFADIVFGYLVPLYGRLGRAGVVESVLAHDRGAWVMGGLGAWALVGLLALGRRDPRAAILGTGVAHGLLHFVVQGKGWEYHLYPFALFAIALGGAGFGRAIADRRPALTGLLWLALVISASGLWAKGAANLDPAWLRAKAVRARAVARAVAPLVSGGGTVQVLDTTDGGIHALLLLGARLPTRFLYDFHFYHDVEHPYVRALRAELLDGLRRHPPVAVVLFERGWPSGDYRRLETFPDLASWLETGYRLAGEGEGFRLYAARRDS
jgi:hypothetical protein